MHNDQTTWRLYAYIDTIRGSCANYQSTWELNAIYPNSNNNLNSNPRKLNYVC